MLLSDFAEWSKFSSAGVGENDIDSSLRLDGLVETIEVGQSGNVSVNASDVVADRLHGRGELFLTAASNEDVGTFSYKELCGGQPYPGCATGNDCHSSLQFPIFGHRWFSSLPLPQSASKDVA